MRLSIDAWLERKDPQVRLLDADSGRELMCLGPEAVREMIDAGDLYPLDLMDELAFCPELFVLLER